MNIVLDIVEDVYGYQLNMQEMYSTLSNAKEDDTVEIPINSFGGSVLDGTAYANIIKGTKAHTTTKILGYAISMGTIIAISADKVTMPTNGYFMIHNPWTVAVGESSDMQKSAKLLETMTDQLVAAYVAKSNQTEEQVRAMMDAETWLTGQEALNMGFVDELYDAEVAEASFDPSLYTNVPQAIMPSEVKEENTDKSMFQTILSKIDGMAAATKEFLTSENEVTNHIETLEQERDDAQAALAASQTKVTELKALAEKVPGLTDQVTALSAEKTALNTEIATLKSRPPADDAQGDEEVPPTGDPDPVDSFTAEAKAKGY